MRFAQLGGVVRCEEGVLLDQVAAEVVAYFVLGRVMVVWGGRR